MDLEASDTMDKITPTVAGVIAIDPMATAMMEHAGVDSWLSTISCKCSYP